MRGAPSVGETAVGGQRACDDLVSVCHKYPPFATGGLAPYVQRSLASLRTSRPDLPATLYTMDFPAGLPAVMREPHGLIVRRRRMPRWIQRRLLSQDRDFARGGQWLFALALAMFNLSTFAAIVVRRSRPTVVAVHDWQSTPVGILATLLCRIPVVFHVHNTELTMVQDGVNYGGGRLIHACERLMARLARAVVVPSPEMAQMLGERGWPVDKIFVVPHGFEAAGFDAWRALPDADREQQIAQLRDELIGPAPGPVIVFAGRLSRVKGIHMLIDAMAAIVAEHPDARLVVLGVGFPGTDEGARVVGHIATLGLSDRVHVYNAYLDSMTVACHFAMADVCVFPSTFEPFGLVSLEAMSLASPVVLGPGFSRRISTGPDGEPLVGLMHEASATAVSQCILEILQDVPSARRRAERARCHVLDTFSWAASTEQLLRVYPVSQRSESLAC